MGHTPHKVALHQITTYTHELIPLDRGAVTQTVTLFLFPWYKYRWASLSVILQFFCETDALSILLQRLYPAAEPYIPSRGRVGCTCTQEYSAQEFFTSFNSSKFFISRMDFDIFSTQDVNSGGIIVAAASLLAASLWLTASWPTGRLDWPLLAT